MKHEMYIIENALPCLSRNVRVVQTYLRETIIQVATRDEVLLREVCALNAREPNRSRHVTSLHVRIPFVSRTITRTRIIILYCIANRTFT